MSRTDDLFDHKLRNETLVRIADAAERIADTLEAIERAPREKLERKLKRMEQDIAEKFKIQESPWRD